MHIGLTYDLREDYLQMGYGEEETAEFDRPDTIAAIEQALLALGHQCERIGHIKALISRLAAGARWDMVFNICEGLHGIAREAQVPAILDAFEIPYTFSDPLVLALTLHKGMTKHVIRDQGVPTPGFHVVHNENEIDRVDLTFPLFAKPIAEGTSKGITARSKITDRRELAEVCRELLAEFKQSVLVERFLPGREFTVGIVGTDDSAVVIGVMEVVLKENADAEVYSYKNKENCEELVLYRIPDAEAVAACSDVALRAWRGLGCRDAGRIDLRMDERGVPNFMEVNPLAGLHPEHSDLPIICTFMRIPYQELIARIIASAAARIG